jgi:hypothetical protein
LLKDVTNVLIAEFTTEEVTHEVSDVAERESERAKVKEVVADLADAGKTLTCIELTSTESNDFTAGSGLVTTEEATEEVSNVDARGKKTSTGCDIAENLGEASGALASFEFRDFTSHQLTGDVVLDLGKGTFGSSLITAEETTEEVSNVDTTGEDTSTGCEVSEDLGESGSTLAGFEVREFASLQLADGKVFDFSEGSLGGSLITTEKTTEEVTNVDTTGEETSTSCYVSENLGGTLAGFELTSDKAFDFTTGSSLVTTEKATEEVTNVDTG